MNELTPDLSLPPLEGDGDTPTLFCEGCGRRLVPTASQGCCDLHFPDGEQQQAAAVAPPAWQAIEPATRQVLLTLSKSFRGVAREWDLLCALPWTKQQLWEHCHLMHAGPNGAHVHVREKLACGHVQRGLLLREDGPRGETRCWVTEMGLFVLATGGEQG